MKKSLIALCGVLSIAAFAEPEAPAAAPAPEAPKACCCKKDAPKPARPLVLNIDEGTTTDQIEAFKKGVLAKIDEAVAAKGPEAAKGAKTVTVFIGGGKMGGFRHGMRGGHGKRGEGMGRRHGKRGHEGMDRRHGHGKPGMGHGKRGHKGMGPRHGHRGPAPVAPQAPAPEAK